MLKKRMPSNQWIAILLAVFSMGYLYMAFFHIPPFGAFIAIDSDVFPKLLGFSLFILSILLFFDRSEQEEGDEVDKHELKEQEEKEKREKEEDYYPEGERDDDHDRHQVENRMADQDHDQEGNRGDDQEVHGEKSHPESEQDTTSTWRGSAKTQVFISFLAVFGYALLFDRAGFVLTTFLFLTVMPIYYGFRKIVFNTIFACVITLGIYYGISKGLGIKLPPGVLGFL